jgi:hypothetical protein
LVGISNAFSSFVKRYFAFALVVTFCMSPLRSATLERLSLNDMIVKSTAIVRAKVADSYTSFSGPVIYTHYRLQVIEQLKGQGTTELVIPGGIAGGQRQFFAGAPVFQKGDQYVFFLWTNSEGLTHVVGLTQGLFRVTDSSANPGLTRAASEEEMLDGKTGHLVKDQTLTMRLDALRAKIKTALQGSAQ